MTNAVQILKSNKVGLVSDESYVVVRDATSFLRVLGSEPEWALMTATASEDHRLIAVCTDQKRLIESALRLGVELDTNPRVETDWLQREYVRICAITRDPGANDERFQSENAALIKRFFEIFDDYRDLDSRAGDEMRELYDVLAIDDQGSEVYLSDGLWLSSDGSLHDRA